MLSVPGPAHTDDAGLRLLYVGLATRLRSRLGQSHTPRRSARARGCPDCALPAEPWPPTTNRWWTVVSSMPHCRLWIAFDWQVALDTAIIAAEFHAGNMRRAGELRHREKVTGTTAKALGTCGSATCRRRSRARRLLGPTMDHR